MYVTKQGSMFDHFREEQVPPEILDLGFFQPHLSRQNPARNKIKDPETCPNSRSFPLKFLILS